MMASTLRRLSFLALLMTGASGCQMNRRCEQAILPPLINISHDVQGTGGCGWRAKIPALIWVRE